MANKKFTVGAGIVLDGEKEYKQAISEITAGQKVNYSELQKAAAQYDATTQKQKLYTEQTRALQGAIDGQREKIDKMREALQHSIATTGEGSKKSMEWQTSLNKAETELLKMNKQLDNYQEEMAQSNTGTGSLADAVRGLADGLGLDLPPMADAAIEKLEGINGSAALTAGLIGGILFKLGEFSIEISQVADDIMTLSDTTGLSTDALQEFEYAAELLDVSSETMQGSMTKMIKSMENAKQGSKQAANAYNELGITITESNGELRDGQTVFYEAIDALGKMTNETQRDAYAMQIFGRSARELNPLINAGSQQLAEYAEEAHKMGYVLDSETLEQFGELDDAMQRLEKQQDAVKYSLAKGLLPIITTFAQLINSIPTPVLTTAIVLGGMIGVVVSLTKAYQSVTMAQKMKAVADLMMAGTGKTVAVTNKAVGASSMVMGAGMQQLLPIIMIVVAALMVLALVLALVMGNTQKTTDEFNKMGAAANNAQGLVNGQANNAYSNLQSPNTPRLFRGTSGHQGGPAIINDSPDGRYGEIVDLPAGSRVYPAGTYPGGDTIVLNVKMDEVSEVQKLLNVVEQAKSSRRRGGG